MGPELCCMRCLALTHQHCVRQTGCLCMPLGTGCLRASAAPRAGVAAPSASTCTHAAAWLPSAGPAASCAELHGCAQASERTRYVELVGLVIVETLQAFGLVAGSAAESEKYRRSACRKLQVGGAGGGQPAALLGRTVTSCCKAHRVGSVAGKCTAAAGGAAQSAGRTQALLMLRGLRGW